MCVTGYFINVSFNHANSYVKQHSINYFPAPSPALYSMKHLCIHQSRSNNLHHLHSLTRCVTGSFWLCITLLRSSLNSCKCITSSAKRKVKSGQTLDMHVGCSSSAVERPTLNRERARVCCHCETLAILFSPQRPSSVSCINEYLAIDNYGNMWVNSL